MAKKKYQIVVPEYSLMILGAKDYDYFYRKSVSYVKDEIDKKALLRDTKKWVSANTNYDTKVLFTLSDSYFAAIGKYCYILIRGGQFDEEHMRSINAHLEELYVKAQEQKESKVMSLEELETDPPKKRIGIQTHLLNRAREVASEIDQMVDGYSNEPSDSKLIEVDIAEFFKPFELKSGHYKYVSEFYVDDVAEMAEVIKGDDKELVESWGHMSKSHVKKLHKFLSEVVEYTTVMKGKTNTGTRKPRSIDRAKQVSKMKFLENCEMTKLESINPLHILGASALWVYNTSTRKLGHYVAIDDDGLGVSGTTIQNFNRDSKESIIVRSSNLDVSKFNKLSEKVRTKRFGELKNMKTALKGRINEHIILLCVEK